MPDMRDTVRIVDRCRYVKCLFHNVEQLKFDNTQCLFFLRIGNEVDSSICDTDARITRILESESHDERLSRSHENILYELHTNTFYSPIGNIEIRRRVDIRESCTEVHGKYSIGSCCVFFENWDSSCIRIDTIVREKITSSGKRSQ